jgi:hypothetical protein
MIWTRWSPVDIIPGRAKSYVQEFLSYAKEERRRADADADVLIAVFGLVGGTGTIEQSKQPATDPFLDDIPV